MVTLLAISSDDSLTGGLEAALGSDRLTFDRSETWESGQQKLLDEGYPGVLVDAATLEIPGHQAFVQLNDVLQKSEASAILLLRGGDGGNFEAMVDPFPSFVGTVDLATDRAAKLASLLEPILERAERAEGGASAGSEGGVDGAEATGEGAAAEVERSLPSLDSGTFAETSLPRLVHTIERREATGRLELAHRDLERHFPFRDGRLLAGGETPVDKLQAAMAWSGGEWTFHEEAVAEGDEVETLPLLFRGAYNHMEQRVAMGALTSEMSEYVFETASSRERREAVEGDDSVETFLEVADGETTLEEALSRLGANRVEGFKAAYVAVETDLVILRSEPGPSPVEVDYAVGASDGAGSAAGSGGEAYSEPKTEDREVSLRGKWNEIEDASPYEVFDLWEGCGEAEVKDRYYELVKDHHPDAYGGNISEEGKELAEKIFVRIKESFSELKRREDEQVVTREEALDQPESDESSRARAASESAGVQAMGSGAMEGSDLAGEPSEPGMERETSVTDEEDRTTDSFDATGAASDSSGESLEERLSSVRSSSGVDDGTSDVGVGGESSGGSSRDDDEDRAEKLKRLKQRREEATDTIPPGDTASPPGDTTIPPGETSPPSGSEGGAGMGGSDISTGVESSTGETSSAAGVGGADSVEDLTVPESEEEAQTYFNKGYRAFKNENHEVAFEYMSKAHEFDESNGLYKTFYGYLLFLTKSDKQRKAHTLLEEAIETENKQALPDAHLFLGRIYKVREKHERAKRHFKQSLNLNPESIEAKRELRVYKIRDEDSGGGSDDDGESGIMDVLNKDIF